MTNARTNRKTDGRTDGVTKSLLELLITANNYYLVQKNVGLKKMWGQHFGGVNILEGMKNVEVQICWDHKFKG
jgi:hypothetical protein